LLILARNEYEVSAYPTIVRN